MPKFQSLIFLQKLKSFFKTAFPENRTELFLFLVLVTAYGILGSDVALNYRIIFDNRIPWDAYFSFDNRSVILNGGGVERHPFSQYFFDTIREFALLFSNGKKNDIFRLVLACCSNFAISLSIVLVFKYLNNIIQLPKRISFLIIAIYAFFSTNILLSFTPENYTFTLLLLILFNYYVALKFRKEKKIPLTALTLGGIAIGGFTITNVVKVFIPVFFERNFFKSFKAFYSGVLRILITSAVFILLVLWRLDFRFQKFFEKSEAELEKFSQYDSTPLWDMIVSWFYGGTILFPGFIIRDHKAKNYEFEAIYMDVFSSPFSYLFVGIIASLLFWSYVKNFRNRLVQILAISFLFDFVIHSVLRFGLHTAYIYGGHFVFVFPIVIGWLFYAFRNSPKITSALYSVLIILLMYLGINNFIRMEEFFQFLENYHQ